MAFKLISGALLAGVMSFTTLALTLPATHRVQVRATVRSEASFVELYEGPLWLAVHANGGILPSRKTIAQWANDFHQRRREFSSLGDPFPATFHHTFKDVPTGTFTYFDPSTCRTGTVVVAR